MINANDLRRGIVFQLDSAPCVVADLRTQCIGCIGRIDDDTAVTDNFDRLLNQPRLWILRVNFEIFCH